jgi:hypothetical protein
MSAGMHAGEGITSRLFLKSLSQLMVSFFLTLSSHELESGCSPTENKERFVLLLTPVLETARCLRAPLLVCHFWLELSEPASLVVGFVLTFYFFLQDLANPIRVVILCLGKCILEENRYVLTPSSPLPASRLNHLRWLGAPLWFTLPVLPGSKPSILDD